jgi:iron(III) transport system substrate-binding protein
MIRVIIFSTVNRGDISVKKQALAVFSSRPVMAALLAGACLAAVPAQAQEKVLNLYSARHYSTDVALYDNFTKATGIKINRIEAGDDQLLARLKTEGAQSPADVILLVDAARLWSAQQDGLFAPVKSATLEQRIPAELRDPQGHWFGYSTRSRVIVYNKVSVKAEDAQTYEQLAAPALKGKVCTRSGAHPYMLSMSGMIIAKVGEAKAEEWAKGVVGNFARKPQGGDTDQIKAVAAGECGVAVTNSYYLARIMKSDKQEDKDIVAKIAIVNPNQASYGTHVNIAGGGMAKNAPNKAAAQAFLEYLASDSAQTYFADGNNEYAAVKSARADNPALKAIGEFKADKTPIDVIGKNTPAAQKMADRVGWK